jgi:hypothetical protein
VALKVGAILSSGGGHDIGQTFLKYLIEMCKCKQNSYIFVDTED